MFTTGFYQCAVRRYREKIRVKDSVWFQDAKRPFVLRFPDSASVYEAGVNALAEQERDDRKG